MPRLNIDVGQKRPKGHAAVKLTARCGPRTGRVLGRSTQGAARAAPDYADAMFNLALLLQRANQPKEAAEYWRRYLATDAQPEWAARARRSLKFCEMQIHLSAC